MSAWPVDPSQPGPTPVETFSVALDPSYLNIQLTTKNPLMVQYWYPVSQNALPAPIIPVLILHGRITSPNYLASYQGFNYLGQLLASNGFFVVSVQQPQVNPMGHFTDDRSQRVRGALNWIAQLNSNVGLQPSFQNLGTYLKGNLLMDRMAAIGHSAGGGFLVVVMPKDPLFQPYPFAALSLLSPDLFPGDQSYKSLQVIAPPPGVPFQIVHGSADCMFFGGYGGWVPYEDLLTTPTCVLRSWVMIDQGNHNFFNTGWTTDECSLGIFCKANPLIDPSLNPMRIAAQPTVTAAYVHAFIQTTVGTVPPLMTGQSPYLDFLNGEAPNPLLAQPQFQNSPFVNVRLDCRASADSILALVDNFEIPWSGSEQPNSIGGNVSASGSVTLTQTSVQSVQNAYIPANTQHLLAARITWTAADAAVTESFGAATVNIIPQTLLRQWCLCFRVGIIEHWPNDNPAVTVDFNIVLIDVNGNTSKVVAVSQFQTIASSWPGITYPSADCTVKPPTASVEQVMRHSFLQLVRIPVSVFAVSTFASAQVNGIRFMFNAASSPSGDIAIDEIHFSL